MSTGAPLFNIPSPLGWAFRRWAEHYNACSTCQADDWYAPILGEPSFCEPGQKLFRLWVQLAMIHPPTQRHELVAALADGDVRAA